MARFRPACDNAGCMETLYSWHDAIELVIWYQHGENREHRMQITDLELVRERGKTLLDDWLRRIHERLDSLGLAGADDAP